MIRQGLIDEVVPSLAAMVDDVVVGFEEFGLRASFSRMNCQTFSCGLSSGQLSPGNGTKVMLGGDDESARQMPAGLIDDKRRRVRPARSERRFRPGAGSWPPCCIWA